MSMTVDARGLACPQPVIQTRKAMQDTDQVVTLVDNETAVTNVSRMARKAGWEVSIVPAGDEFRIEMTKGAAPSKSKLAEGKAEALGAPLTLGRAEVVEGPLVLVVTADVMGRGEPELGSILIRGFFHTLGEVEPLPRTIIFFNTGVKLACEGSPVLDDLRALEAGGIEILVCGTCLDYFQLTAKLAAGQVSNMYDIAETMLRAGKVLTL
jgi:selenium metabolism protein YedF